MMAEKNDVKKEKMSCPYCDKEISESPFPYCKPCQLTKFYCPQCHQPVSRDIDVCPKCGTIIKK